MRYPVPKLTLVFLVITASNGCTPTTRDASLQSMPSLCASFEVIHPSREDMLTTDTKRQILAHNEVYRAMCPIA